MKENCQIPEVNAHVNSKHGDFFQVVQTVRLQYTHLDFKKKFTQWWCHWRILYFQTKIKIEDIVFFPKERKLSNS